MTITIPNADTNLLQTLEKINENLNEPYKIIKDEDNRLNIETLEAILEVEKGEVEKFRDFESYKKVMDS